MYESVSNLLGHLTRSISNGGASDELSADISLSHESHLCMNVSLSTVSVSVSLNSYIISSYCGNILYDPKYSIFESSPKHTTLVASRNLQCHHPHNAVKWLITLMLIMHISNEMLLGEFRGKTQNQKKVIFAYRK